MTIPPELAGPLKLFIKELDSHLTYFRDLLAKGPAFDETQLKALAHRCHVVKGGAGFFQLALIRDLAGEGEKKFRSQLSADEYKELLSKITQGLDSELELLKQ